MAGKDGAAGLERQQAVRAGVNLVSLLLFPATFYYFSPVIPLAGAAAGVLTGSLVVFGLLALSAVFLGRSFCSWLCPAGVIQDQTARCRQAAFPRRRLNWLKYLVWASWLGVLLALFHAAGGLKALDAGFATTAGFSVADLAGLIVYLMVALVFFLLALAGGRRTACHTICWMAPFLIAGRALGRLLRLPRRRLLADPAACVACQACDRACPMSLEVARLVAARRTDQSDCILCGQCVSGCRHGALRLGWRDRQG